MSYPIPYAALDDRLAFIGTSGSGKTYAAGTAIERLLRKGARVVIIDPLDVWWGLRLKANGEDRSWPVVIFGGSKADLLISEATGGVIGETAAQMAESCIVSLGHFKTAASRRRFMLAFLEHFDASATGEPVHLIFDEADMFAPQKSSEPMLQALMEGIVRRGRVKGFIPWLITQRPAVLSKDVLSQADGVVAMKLTMAHDRRAMKGWVEATADPSQWRDIDAKLPTLTTGHGFVWIPSRGVIAPAAFPTKQSFDSSRTPVRGEPIRKTHPKPIDLTAVRATLAEVEAAATKAAKSKAKGKAAPLVVIHDQSGPGTPTLSGDDLMRINGDTKARAAEALSAMHAEKRRLEDALRQAQIRVRQLEGQVEDAWRAGALAHAEGYKAALRDVTAAVGQIGTTYDGAEKVNSARQAKPVAKFIPLTGESQARRLANGHQARQERQRAPAAPIPLAEDLGPALKPLRVLATHYPGWFPEGQWATLAGLSAKGGTWHRYRTKLKAAGLVDNRGGLWAATPLGLEAAGEVPPAPGTIGERIDMWVKAVGGGGAGRVLRFLADMYPNRYNRDAIAEATNLTARGGTFTRYMGLLGSNGLVVREGEHYRAAPNLFDDGDLK